MFITHMPGRIVRCETITVPSGKTVMAGRDGLFSKIKLLSEGVVVSACESADKTTGYTADMGEIIDFSGTINLFNPKNDDATASVVCFDTI